MMVGLRVVFKVSSTNFDLDTKVLLVYAEEAKQSANVLHKQQKNIEKKIKKEHSKKLERCKEKHHEHLQNLREAANKILEVLPNTESNSQSGSKRRGSSPDRKRGTNECNECFRKQKQIWRLQDDLKSFNEMLSTHVHVSELKNWKQKYNEEKLAKEEFARRYFVPNNHLMGSYLQKLRTAMSITHETNNEPQIENISEQLNGVDLEDPNTNVDKDETVDAQGASDATTDIVKEDIVLPKCWKGKLAFVLKNVLSKKECKDYIKKTESMGYTEALVNVGNGKQQLMKDVRNNTRCIWDSFKEADIIWQRIKQFIPEIWRDRKVMGLNERLRFLRYHPGEYFAPHMDGMYMRENGERSYISIQLYLNEGFKGGSTTFMNYAEEERVEVVPKIGMILVFQHDIMHEGSELLKGTKYTMRTDIMFSSE